MGAVMYMVFNLDIIIIAVLITMLVIGYYKGMVNRALSLGFSIVNVLFSWFFSRFLQNYIHLSMGDLPLKAWIEPLTSRVIAFVGCFIFLAIVFAIVLHFLNAIIKTIKKHLHLVAVLDGILGAILNGLKGFIYIYVALCVMSLPMFETTAAMVSQSELAPLINQMAPDVFETLKTSGEKLYAFSSKEDFNIEDLVELMDALHQLGLLDETSADTLYTTYQAEIDQLACVSKNEQDYQALILKVQSLPLSDAFKSVVQSKIVLN